MKNIRNSAILKILCYILIPILAGIIVLSIIFLEISNEYQENEITDYTRNTEICKFIFRFYN